MEAQDTIDESDSKKSYLGYVSRFFLLNVDKEYIPQNFLGAINILLGENMFPFGYDVSQSMIRKGKKFRVVNTSTE